MPKFSVRSLPAWCDLKATLLEVGDQLANLARHNSAQSSQLAAVWQTQTLPSLPPTDRDGEGTDIVIWKRVAERDFRGIEQVLSVHEGDRAFNSWFRCHDLRQKNNPV